MKSVSIFCRTALPAIVLYLCCLIATPAPAAEIASPLPGGVASSSTSAATADELMAKGRLALKNGAFADAAASYQSAAGLYAKRNQQSSRCEALIRLAQALNYIGQYRNALENGEKAAVMARELNDGQKIAAALGTVGNSLLGTGETGKAEQKLNEALAIARDGKFDDTSAAILTNMGNLLVSQQKYGEALAAFKESAVLAAKAGDRQAAAAAAVNAATAAVRDGSQAEAGPLLATAAEHLRQVEDSSGKAYSLINAGLVGNSLRSLNPQQSKFLMLQSYTAFGDALATAERINDLRTASYAYGYLGQLYEEDGQLTTAQELTGRAIFAAQQQGAAESLYRWHWQSGRILGRLGKIDEAIGSYRHAIRNLQSVREEMASCYANPESTYQKSAGVISAELVDLLLQQSARLEGSQAAEAYLVEARNALEILKVFELREYFKDDCIDAAQTVAKSLDSVSKNTVIFYPILLKDRVELLVSLDGKLKRIRISATVDEFTQEIRDFRRKLVKRTTLEFLPHARKLYDWLVRPLEADLAAVKAETLVFVPDGALRSVPMAALHDGSQFLVSRYRIAITPSMNLTDPRPVNREHAKMLSVGLTQAVQGFPGLPYVADELQAVRGIYGGQLLLDRDFLLGSLEKELKKEPYSMIHVATHGQFGGSVGETFILAFKEKFSMERLGEYIGLLRFRDEPLDLLTLSACETATGDDRAALGLAGVAVRAGARSALATLWHINDPASYELIAEFYRQLRNPAISRAGALQAAQLKLLGDIRYDHPGYWAPFLLINNWL